MENIRNFAIISHIDHGKSTLADRFLEITGTVAKEKMRPQYLDMMDLEREKGITIKMQPCRMVYTYNSNSYILNLIDTPGHVDFSYEVSRSLAAVEGVILLVDATKGIQAQTIANLELAQKSRLLKDGVEDPLFEGSGQNLVIIPVVNKIDSLNARTEQTKEEMAVLLGMAAQDVLAISAKEGTNVETLLQTVIEKILPPSGSLEKPLRALIFDSKYDAYKGVIAYVRIQEGGIKEQEEIYLIAGKTKSKIKEIGYFTPLLTPQKKLQAKEIGYIATGIKEPGKVRVGDTITVVNFKAEPLPGYKEPQSMIFASIYPENPHDFELLKDSLNKLQLNDASLFFEPEAQEALGRGFRCGFLGNLHAEIVSERLHREFDLNLVISTPQVLYKIIGKNGEEKPIFSASDWPATSDIQEGREPWVKLEVITPLNYFGQVSELLSKIKGNYQEKRYFGLEKILLIYETPLREIVTGFYDSLKSASQGFASMHYELLGFRSADLVKLEILIAGRREESFSKIVARDEAMEEGRRVVAKLKEVLPPQLFSVPLQAALGGKIIARETIRAKGKDVIAPLYGGDYSRKRKLLEKQKKGKKELKEKGKIKIPSSVFLEMMKK